MNSMLLTNSSTAASVASGGVIPLGGAVHGTGKSIVLSGNEIALGCAGYYDVECNVTAEVTAVDPLSVQLYLNGVAVSGAIATATPAGAGDVVNLTIPWTVRKACACNEARLTFVASAACTVQNITVEVRKG